MASASLGSAMSTGTDSTRAPSWRIEAATVATLASWMSARSSVDPAAASVRAIRSPMPWAAPVTIATVPASSDIGPVLTPQAGSRRSIGLLTLA
jgi:hypothetical protein